MGTKTPPSSKPTPLASSERDIGDRFAWPDGPVVSPILQRVASALQVPLSTLYNPPNGGGPTPHGDTEGECATLLRAYQSIRDPEERQRLLTLVQEAAK